MPETNLSLYAEEPSATMTVVGGLLEDYPALDKVLDTPLFDHKFYRGIAGAAHLDADDRLGLARHYLAKGAAAGLNPSPYFDAAWYVQVNSDVDFSKILPLVHFLDVGAVEGRDPNATFQSAWYRLFYPEVARSGTVPILHYIAVGRAQGRLTRPAHSAEPKAPIAWAVAPAGLLDDNLSFAPDQIDGTSHYRGEMLEFRDVHGDFDEWNYLYYNADVARHVAEATLNSGQDHFERYGRDEYLKGLRELPRTRRELSYLLRNPDVNALIAQGQFASGFEHWQKVGRREELSGLRQPYRSGASMDASQWDLSTWRDGYVILPGMFGADRCDVMVELMSRLWAERDKVDLPINMEVFLDRTDGNKQMLLRNAPEAAYDHPFKINNLYYWTRQGRDMVLDERLCTVLRSLLDGDPAVMTSLNFRKGSQQAMHLDTFYMPSAIPYRMVAAWIALEDVTEENGPLLYIPGTNRIPPYYFEGHRLWTNNSTQEYAAFDHYFDRKIAEEGLSKKKLLIKKGDVLIWHSLLQHGGDAIVNHTDTRFSMVAHYFVAADYPGGSSTKLPTTRLAQEGFGRFYEDRWPQFSPVR